jgi:hypothetical protein
MLREEIEALQQDDERIEQARQILMGALRAGTLTAWGKRDARRGVPNPTASYEAITASVYLDDLVSITAWGTVGADPKQLEAICNYHGPSFRDVRFYTADVLKVCPARRVAETTNMRTIASERKLAKWLTELMRTKRDAPMSKAATKRAAAAKGLHFSDRAFISAWASAVRESGAARWSSPGRRKSKRRIDTEK